MSILLLFANASQTIGLPSGLLSALCWVESRHSISAINKTDNGSASVGLCQVKYNTAKLVGYKGTVKQLHKDPMTNVFYAARYLKKQIDRYDGDYRKAVAAYNAGKFIVSKDGQNPVNKDYVKKVFNAWAEHR